MTDDFERDASQFFDRVLDKIAGHARYASLVQRAVDAQRMIIFNYHTHGPGQGYCVSICTREDPIAALDLDPPLDELAHVRGIAREEAECDALMRVLAARFKARYGIDREPAVFLNGRPRSAG